jgi:hypothetical protein
VHFYSLHHICNYRHRNIPPLCQKFRAGRKIPSANTMRTVVVQWKEDVAIEEAGSLLQGGGGGEEEGGARRPGGGGGGRGVTAAFARRSTQFPLKAWLRETVHHRATMETLIRIKKTFLECLT